MRNLRFSQERFLVKYLDYQVTGWGRNTGSTQPAGSQPVSTIWTRLKGFLRQWCGPILWTEPWGILAPSPARTASCRGRWAGRELHLYSFGTYTLTYFRPVTAVYGWTGRNHGASLIATSSQLQPPRWIGWWASGQTRASRPRITHMPKNLLYFRSFYFEYYRNIKLINFKCKI